MGRHGGVYKQVYLREKREFGGAVLPEKLRDLPSVQHLQGPGVSVGSVPV